MKEDNFKIDFVGIGAPKCATTWIFKCLEEHPEICGSSKKEISFFNKEHRFKKGLDYYKSFYDHCEKNSIKGEFTPYYLYSDKASGLLKKYFPEVKLIVSIRDPLERAYSHYKFSKGLGGRFSIYDTFEEAVRKDNSLLRLGKYYRYLKNYFEKFSKENIVVLVYDEIRENPIETVQNLYDFLEIKSDFIPSAATQKENPTRKREVKAKIPFVNQFLYRNWNRIEEKPKLVSLLRKMRLKKWGEKIVNSNRIKLGSRGVQSTSVEDIDSEFRKKIRNEYHEDIKRLETLTNKNLKDWY